MPNTIMAQGLDSTSTNNLTSPVTQCARVLHHKAYLKFHSIDKNEGA